MKIKATVGSLLPVTKPPKTPLTNTPISILPTTPQKVKSRPHKTNKHPPRATIGNKILDLNTNTIDVNNSNTTDNPYNLPYPPDKTHIPGTVTLYSPELATKILLSIRDSDDCVDHVLDSLNIVRSTWYDWITRYPELGDEYDLILQSRARAEVERRETQWNETVDRILDSPCPDPQDLQRVDAQSRALDRRCRYTQWRAQVHNPGRFAPRALLGVQSLDPQSLLAQQYTPPSAQITSYIDSNNVPTADTDSVNNQQVTDEST